MGSRHASDSFGQLLSDTLARYETAAPEPDAAAPVDAAAEEGPSPTLAEFDIVEEAEVEEPVADAGDWRLSLLTRLAGEAGLDRQDYRCKTCRKNIGLTSGKGLACRRRKCVSGAGTGRTACAPSTAAPTAWTATGTTSCGSPLASSSAGTSPNARVPHSPILLGEGGKSSRALSVSRASKAFLEHVGDKPLIDLEKANSSLYDAVPAMATILVLLPPGSC